MEKCRFCHKHEALIQRCEKHQCQNKAVFACWYCMQKLMNTKPFWLMFMCSEECSTAYTDERKHLYIWPLIDYTILVVTYKPNVILEAVEYMYDFMSSVQEGGAIQ